MIKQETAYEQALDKSLTKWQAVIKQKEKLSWATNVPCKLCEFQDEYTSSSACDDCILNVYGKSCRSFWKITHALDVIEQEAYKIIDTLTRTKNSL